MTTQPDNFIDRLRAAREADAARPQPVSAVTLAGVACLIAMGATDAEAAASMDLIGSSPVANTVPEVLSQLRTALAFTQAADGIAQDQETKG